jgi:hypothetical protein
LSTRVVAAPRWWVSTEPREPLKDMTTFLLRRRGVVVCTCSTAAREDMTTHAIA